MPLQPSWQVWRRSYLPIAESILGVGNRRLPRPENLFAKSTDQQRRWRQPVRHLTSRPPDLPVYPSHFESESVTKEVKERKQELDRSGIEAYPRYHNDLNRTRGIREFYNLFEGVSVENSPSEEQDVVEVMGRIASMRLMGKMAFIDILEDQLRLQVMLSFTSLEGTGVSRAEFGAHCRLMRRGDHITVTGRPCRTDTGQLSIKPTALPRIMSPCLQRFPTENHNDTASAMAHEAEDRQVQMLADPNIVSTIKTRASIIHHMRTFFRQHNFVEVETPILSAMAGGATARPFETTATEFKDRKLSLRIAPELWLKKLIVGGMVRIFEIGPSFRNEGLDKTHNPEFTTCEFYCVRDDLTLLKDRTEALLFYIAKAIEIDGSEFGDDSMASFFSPPYSEIDFIPALNAALELDLPNLRSETAREQLLEIFESKNLPVPSKPTLPRLLDKLSSIYLEPQCDKPTWIMNTPECLSPLSKSFIHPTAANSQAVAARAELFVKGKEIVNCYEEENDPFSQRRKFIDQQVYGHDTNSGKIDDEAMKIDEDYIRALEWGLPPTGGWGCGIDRLVMLFTGKERIGDVLAFGNLRAVTRGAELLNGEENR